MAVQGESRIDAFIRRTIPAYVNGELVRVLDEVTGTNRAYNEGFFQAITERVADHCYLQEVYEYFLKKDILSEYISVQFAMNYGTCYLKDLVERRRISVSSVERYIQTILVTNPDNPDAFEHVRTIIEDVLHGDFPFTYEIGFDYAMAYQFTLSMLTPDPAFATRRYTLRRFHAYGDDAELRTQREEAMKRGMQQYVDTGASDLSSHDLWRVTIVKDVPPRTGAAATPAAEEVDEDD